MEEFRYMIIGAGMTGYAAVRGIRELDPNGTVLMIGNEPHPPYKRPPLTKGLWAGKPVEKIWLNLDEYQVKLQLGSTVTLVNPREKQIQLNDGRSLSYQKLLFATGVRPRRLNTGEDAITYLRTFDDYLRLADLSQHAASFGIIGGGFIGSELSAALAAKGNPVTLFMQEESIGSKIFPHDLAMYLNGYFRSYGVNVVSESLIESVTRQDDQFIISQRDRKPFTVSAVAAGIGTVPNIELASNAKINTGNGIPVDEFLMTDAPDIYAAGDVAEFYQPLMAKRIRIEHEDNALSMGKQAGRNMAGAHESYTHLPFFYSDLFDLGYEAVGSLDARFDIFADWQEPYRKGVLYYLSDHQLRGVLLWNVWNSLDKARELLKTAERIKPGDLKGRIG